MNQTTRPPDVLDGRGRRYVHYDPADDLAPSTTLALAIADLHDVHPTELPPLGYATDTDALDALVADGATDVDGDVAFAFAGFDVTVTASGLAVLDPVDGDADPDLDGDGEQYA